MTNWVKKQVEKIPVSLKPASAVAKKPVNKGALHRASCSKCCIA